MNDELIWKSDAIKVTWQEPSYTDAINALTEARERINNIPAVEPKKVCIGQIHFDDEKLHEIVDEAMKKLKEEIEPKQGEWIYHEDYHTCSVCGVDWVFTDGTDGSDFCPNCGARMFAKDTNVPNKEGADDE